MDGVVNIENYMKPEIKQKTNSEQVGVLSTFVKSEELAEKMIRLAIASKLSVRGQYGKVKSTSWWHGEIQELVEFKVEFLCRKVNAAKLLNQLKPLHTYALPAFTYQDVMCDEDTQIWTKVV